VDNIMEEEKKKDNNTKNGCVGCLTIIVFIIAIIFGLKSCMFGGSKKEDSEPQKQEKDMTAYVIADAQSQVDTKLKSPKSASYPWGYDSYQISTTDGTHEGYKRYTIKGYVDADNSFGASIRTNFVVVLEASPDSEEYYPISVDLQ
jgi:hypothetical protein